MHEIPGEIRNEPTGGVAETKALAAKSGDFGIDKAISDGIEEASEALDQRMKALEDLGGQTTNTIIRLDQRTLETLEHITSALKSAVSAAEALKTQVTFLNGVVIGISARQDAHEKEQP